MDKQQQKVIAGGEYAVCFDQKVGEGQFGVVVSCQSCKDPGGPPLVAKIVLSSVSRGLNEHAVLSALQCKPLRNVIKVFAIAQDQLHTYYIMEKCDLSLRQVIQQRQATSEYTEPSLAQKIIREIKIGYQELLKAHIVHCDLKPENILIKFSGSEMEIKLIDFGSSALTGHVRTASKRLQPCTRKYKAPEYFFSEHPLEPKALSASDMFSLGLIYYELLFNQLPKGLMQNQLAFLQSLKEHDLDVEQSVGGHVIEAEVRKELRTMLKYDKGKRATWNLVNFS